ncbi:MAG: SEL1-like repeat protein [Rhodospirillales bacterium]|nr:SEL1-like repeat protein [Rhodospirillales bacterium]
MKNIPVFIFLAFVLASCAGLDSAPSPVVEQLEERAANGDAESQYNLALRYTNGSGVNQNYAKAAEWLKGASAQGHHKAAYLLGVAYNTGRGVELNKEEAIRLFTQAANAGHARAQYQLGEAFANGRGAEKDLLWASRWYEKAARQKHAEASFSLGVMRAAGIDAKADMEQAWLWLQLANENGHALAVTVRDKVAEVLTPSALLKAKVRAAGWQWSTDERHDDAPTLRYIQRGLNKLGFPAGKDDGLLGTVTIAAITAFQKSRGMESSATINPELVSRIRTELSRVK